MTKTLKIKSIKKIEKNNSKVYDIEVKDSHHYILENGIVSHNSGGSGLKYAASSILFLSKAKDKAGNDVVGNIITVTNKKGRLTKENSQIKLKLNYDTGLNPYYGLLELGEKYKLFTKISNKYEINGQKAFESVILKNPEKYFTQEILDQLDVCAREEFYYGLKKKNYPETQEDTIEEDEDDE